MSQLLIKAFKAEALAVNPIPFARGLVKLLELEGMDKIQSDEGKAILWDLNQMAYGQLATIDMIEEWNRLNEVL